MLEDDQYIIGTGKDQVKVRLVNFCDLETKTEFRLVTNLPETGEAGRSNEDIADFYRLFEVTVREWSLYRDRLWVIVLSYMNKAPLSKVSSPWMANRVVLEVFENES
ncbi:MAG: hypothetical protein F6K53_17230 [Moorea sp. SIO4A1]|nr:hypothetical protein [Moorena sp. SIO4A5]NEQ59044.1 hypothetical protein [Moorena sp. SIO4A1]